MFGRKRKAISADEAAALYTRARELKAWSDRPEKIRLLSAAADAGHKVSAFDLGVIHEKDHDLEAARRRYQQAADLGHAVAPKFVAALGEKEDHVAVKQRRLDGIRAKAEAGDAAAMREYGWELDADHDTAEGGFPWYERAAEAGDRIALRHIADRLPYRDKDKGVARGEKMLRDDADDGDVHALEALAEFLRQHHPEGAVDILMRLDDKGNSDASRTLGHLYWRHGRAAHAERWLRRAMSVATDQADEVAAELGCVLLERGNAEEAEPLLRRDMGGDLHLAWLLEARGDDDDALELYGTLVEQDDDQFEAKAGLARICRRRGEVADAEMWTEQALQAGADMNLPVFVRP